MREMSELLWLLIKGDTLLKQLMSFNLEEMELYEWQWGGKKRLIKTEKKE